MVAILLMHTSLPIAHKGTQFSFDLVRNAAHFVLFWWGGEGHDDPKKC